MRVSGLASGIDTESIINDMMRAHRMPLDKITQKKQYLEWQLDDYRSINRDLRQRSDALFDTVIGNSATFNKKNVNISDPNAISINGNNAANDFAGTIQVNQLATQATLQSGQSLDLGKDAGKKTLKELGLAEGSTSITIQVPHSSEAKTVELKENMTLDQAMSAITKQTGAMAFYDAHSGKVALTSKQTGAGNLQVSGDFATKMGIAHDGENGIGQAVAGKNAKFIFNGLETERETNTFNISGFDITLKQVTTQPVTFSSSPDVDSVMESIEKFVDDYNELIGDLNTKVREPKYRSFHPLSSEEKEAMKDREIELWEEKAKSGTLRNDPTLTNMLAGMRTAMTSSVTIGEGENKRTISLRDIGITPSKAYLENGKLEIDKDKLREAIQQDPSAVRELFAQPKAQSENGKGGIAVQYREAMDNARTTISQRAGTAGAGVDSFTLGRSLKTMNQQIERFEERLQATEERYWRQFTAMERAIQKANEQSAQLMNSLGGM